MIKLPYGIADFHASVHLSSKRTRISPAPKARHHPSLGQRPSIDPKTQKGLKARPNAMPQSLSLTIIHVIFSTKERRPFLGPEVRIKTHAYLATVARNLGCEAYRVGGIADHVHLAIRLSRTISIADLVQELKTASSKWLKTQSPDLHDFAWQRGYGCFSVGPSDLDALRAYIDNQEKRHTKRTFQDEFRSFLRKYDLEYDETHVWD